MTNFKFATALFLTALSIQTFAASNPDYSTGTKIHTTSSHYTVGGDPVKFSVVSPDGCDESSLQAAAEKVKNRSKTDAWDNKLYAFSVNPGSCLLIGWYDTKTNQFGWAAAENAPNTWNVRSNSSDWIAITNGASHTYNYTLNGQKVSLRLFNPFNQIALTGNDILVSFGF